MSAAPSVEAKRGPGRPRKNPLHVAVAAPVKRRGRPPKSAAAPVAAAQRQGLFTAEQTAQIARDAVASALARLGVTNLPSDAPIAVNDKISQASRAMVAQRKAEKEAPRAVHAATVAVPAAVPKRRGRAVAAPAVAPLPIDDRPDTIRRSGQSLNMFGSHVAGQGQPPAPIRH